MDWKNCLSQREIKEVSIDYELISSLEKTSVDKLHSATFLPETERTIGSKISLVYDAVRELIEAVALLKGYKIYNHVCYVALLKEILNKSEAGDLFDEVRKIRNDINYYGKRISLDEGKYVLDLLAQLRSLFLSLLKENKKGMI